MQEIGMAMQDDTGEKNRKINMTGLSSQDATGSESAALQSTAAERMSLSLLRRRIRAGWYEDDLSSQSAQRLLFLRWLVREGLLTEWEEGEG